MINHYLKYKLKDKVSALPDDVDIAKSKKILFSIFTRYGDTVIDLVVIKEFIDLFPQKKYLILCPTQMKPYVNEFLPNIECIAFNKRNLFKLFKVIRLLKKRMFDIGYNPWSNGFDSSYLISHCKKFIFYMDFDKPAIINHYQIVRRYLKLPEKDWSRKELILKESYKKILICPQSTDIKRNIQSEDLNRLILDLQKKYYHPEIVIASMNKSDFRKGCEKFVFEKTANSSEMFIDLVKNSSLIVCADSGPFHIAMALKKDILLLLKSTLPEIVINSGSRLKVKSFNI